MEFSSPECSERDRGRQTASGCRSFKRVSSPGAGQACQCQCGAEEKVAKGPDVKKEGFQTQSREKAQYDAFAPKAALNLQTPA